MKRKPIDVAAELIALGHEVDFTDNSNRNVQYGTGKTDKLRLRWDSIRGQIEISARTHFDRWAISIDYVSPIPFNQKQLVRLINKASLLAVEKKFPDNEPPFILSWR